MFRDLNPQYDEFFEMGNMQAGTVLVAEVGNLQGVRPAACAVWSCTQRARCRHLVCCIWHTRTPADRSGTRTSSRRTTCWGGRNGSLRPGRALLSMPCRCGCRWSISKSGREAPGSWSWR